MVPNGPKNRPDWTPKSLTNPFCDFRACRGVLGYPPGPQNCQKLDGFDIAFARRLGQFAMPPFF